ncbi:pectate lyase [Bacteroides acidifaciens]|uniref:pectate lyase n=1 Tax=Bacteroides acidifaciens TaxID=85831 RepID=UPI003C6CA35C
MNNILLKSLILVSTLCACSKEPLSVQQYMPPDTKHLTEYPAPDRSNIPAFPGAFGGGRYTKGGAEGTVYTVSSLKDDNSIGTLRWALNQKGPRTIVFAIGGLIELQSKLIIKNGDVTVAGQTAPGDGICLKGNTLNIKADNVIIRFIRCRMGSDMLTETEADGADTMWGKNQKNIIIDHCSMSWSTDECASFYDNENFTMQWCIIAESLAYSIHGKGAHGFGGIWGGLTATFHHNLIAHHSSRTPRLCGSRYTGEPNKQKVDIRNNVFYNWGPSNGGYAGEGGFYNFINNYYKPGPATIQNKNIVNRIFSPNGDDGKNKNEKGIWGVFYLNGNYFDDSCILLPPKYKPLLAEVNRDNKAGLHPKETTEIPMPRGGISSLTSNFEFAITKDVSLFTESAKEAYESVLAKAGASLRWDNVDKRIVENVKNGSYTAKGSNGSNWGIIDDANDVGGWPNYFSGKKVIDSDGDGIPDEWEKSNNLNPNDSSDGSKYNISKEYTNLEVYINSLVETLMK